MRTSILITIILLGLGTLSCSTTLSPIAAQRAPSIQAANIDTQESRLYETVISVVWKLDSKTKVEARIEALDPSRSGSTALPSTRLKIKNLETGQLVYEQDSSDRPISMYTRDLNDDWSDELILTWGGGSADRLDIITVNATQARVVLSESYRIDAVLMDLSGKGMIDVLISTGDSGAGPFHTTRYAWKNNRYVPVGRSPYQVLIRSLEKQFASVP